MPAQRVPGGEATAIVEVESCWVVRGTQLLPKLCPLTPALSPDGGEGEEGAVTSNVIEVVTRVLCYASRETGA